MARRFFVRASPIVLLLFSQSIRAQAAQALPDSAETATKAQAPDPTNAVPPQDKRILGVLPNYRTAERTAIYQPISAKYKFKIAVKDSFDYPLFGVAAIYASLYQLEDSHPQFGQGIEGYARRLGTSYCDQVVGNMMTEGILPIFFKEDPRYFRMAEGPVKKRAFYALSRIFVTKTDTGRASFNFAEIFGNGISAGVGLSYYSDDRNAADFLQNWATQLATDATSQVLKEFWPDIKRWYKNRHAAHDAGSGI